MGRTEETPLVPSQHFCYQRTARDRVWTLVFFLFWLSCIAGGIYGIVHRQALIRAVDNRALEPPVTCLLVKLSPGRRVGTGYITAVLQPLLFLHRNPSFTLDIKYLDNPKHCPYNRGRSLLSEQVWQPPPTTPSNQH